MHNKEHCLACALGQAYVDWCKLNGRADVEDRMQMVAAFFAAVIKKELDVEVHGVSIPNRAAQLMAEASASTKH